MELLSSETGYVTPHSHRASISLILPAWNEAEAIRRAIAEADDALRNITLDYEIIVVDDGSSDDTAVLTARAAESNPHVRLLRHESNQGYGAALRSGFQAARHELVVFTDADNQFDLSELDRFVLLSAKYDIVCGYRIDRKDSWLRCLYSRVYNQLVRLLLRTGVRDVDCALKMFHRDVVKKLTISTDGFLVNSELLTQAKRQGYSIVEVGVSHRSRTEGSSTVSAAHIPVVLCNLVRFWWNKVQFPGANESDATRADEDPETAVDAKWLGWAQLVLLMVAAVVVLTNLGYPLIDRDETRYAEIPREMLETGNWVLPQLNFQPYYDKPPLLYWLCAISYSIFGVSEWSARLVPATAAIGTLMLTMWFGSRTQGKRIGLLSGIVLMLSVGFLLTSRYLLIDGVLTFLTTLALMAAYLAIRTAKLHLGWWSVASAACGFAFLAKGPIALVLVIPPVFAYAWLTEARVRPSLRHWAMMGGIAGLIAIPWFVAVSLQDTNFAYEFFYKHNFSRFAGAFHARPFWFFVPVLLIGGHPWTFLSIPYTVFLLSHKQEDCRRRPPVLGFLTLWSLWCFAFFSASSCKLPTYILPIAPAAALMFAHYLEHILFSPATSSIVDFARRRSPWLATASTCLAATGFAGFAYMTELELPNTVLVVTGIGGLMSVVFVLAIRKTSNPRVGWSVATAVTLLFVVTMLHREIPRYAKARTVFGPGSPLLGELDPAIRLPILTVAHEWAGIPFYLNRSDIKNLLRLDAAALTEFVSNHRRAWVVLYHDGQSQQLRENLPPAFELTSVTTRGPAHLFMITAKVDGEKLAKGETATAPRR